MSGQPRVVLQLAWRFLRSKASDGFLSLISWVSVIGVALGVVALVVVTSVINGFEGELIRVITGMNGEVLLYTRGDPIVSPEKVEARIREVAPETRAITAAFVSEMMVAGPSAVAGAVLEGIDPATIGKVTEIPKRLREGAMPSDVRGPDGVIEVALGSAVADRIGAKVGDRVRLVAPFLGGDGGEGAAPKVFPVKVVGIIKMGMHDYDSKWVFAHLKSVQALLGYPGRVTTFKLRIEPRDEARNVASRLSDNFGYPFRARDWSQLNQNLFRAIEHQKAVISISLTLIVIVAAFNVVSTLMMMIYDKTKELAILKAMGLSPMQAFALFCSIGAGIGAVGVITGIGAGAALNDILATTKFIELPPDIYSIGFLPVVTHWSEVLKIGAVAFLICFLAAVYPAWQVAKRPPLEGIRYE